MTPAHTTRYVTLLSVILALALTAALAACGSDEPSGGAGPAETDRKTLVALYNATDGENWNGSANWLSDAPLGEWEGVTTNNDGRVTALGLGENALSGEIPAELGSLSNLTWLDLSRQPLERGDTGGAGQPLQPDTGCTSAVNELSGEIPAELGSLSKLVSAGPRRSTS